MTEVQFPNNSNKSKEERPKLKSVVTGTVSVKKKSGGVTGTVWGKYVKPALIFAGVSIILPALKDMAEDAITSMIRGAFSGGDYSRSRRSSGNGYVNYSDFGKPKRENQVREISQRARATHDFGELVLETRVECDRILSDLQDLIDKYGYAKVSDMYDAAGITPSFTDDKWGWDDLNGAHARRVPGGGYLLVMPKPVAID